MIKTLRITSILAAALAIIMVGFFVFRIVRGAKGDASVREFLNSPGVIEKFKMAEGNQSKVNTGQVSPLVQQAQAIALYLNPPAQKGQQNIRQGLSIEGTGAQINVTPKFKVLGISYYAGNPALSMVLIDEPGKGAHWVKQSTQVGHLFIQEIQSDLVVVQGGTETFKIPAERELPKPKTAASSPAGVAKKPATPNTSRPRPQTPEANRPTAQRAPVNPPQTQTKDEKNEKLEELYDRLKEIKANTDNNDTEASEQERAEQIEKLISNFKASYISAEEAKKLEDLGQQLGNTQNEPNTAQSGDKM